MERTFFMAKPSTPNPSFPQYICPIIGHRDNPGMDCLTSSRHNLTVSPNGRTVLSKIPGTPLSFETGGVIKLWF